MNLISLQAIPNQAFFIILEGNRYNISVVECAGVMGVSITRNDEIIIENIRATAGTPLLPYLYEEDGNFMFVNINDEIIYYPNFGSTQNLFYLTVADLQNLRSNP
jgi:hypothetical protein